MELSPGGICRCAARPDRRGGAAAHRARAWRAATGTELYEALGMSEISTYISTGPGMAIKPGSPGKPQPGRKVVILPAEAPDDSGDESADETAPEIAAGGSAGLSVAPEA